MKVTLFTNLVVCKVKQNEWNSVLLVTDQIMEMDPRNKKSLFYRARSQKELEKFKDASETITTYLEEYPDDVDGKNLQQNIQKAWRADQEKQGKMF